MSEFLKIPPAFQDALAKIVDNTQEAGFSLLIRKRLGPDGKSIYKPEALVLTGIGSPGSIEDDPRAIGLVNGYLNDPENRDVWFVLGHTHSKGTYKLGSQYAEGFSGTDNGYRVSLDRASMAEQRNQRHSRCLGFMLATYKPTPNNQRSRGHTTTVFFEPYTTPGQTQRVIDF